MLKFKYRFESLADNYDIGELNLISPRPLRKMWWNAVCVRACAQALTIFASVRHNSKTGIYILVQISSPK